MKMVGGAGKQQARRLRRSYLAGAAKPSLVGVITLWRRRRLEFDGMGMVNGGGIWRCPRRLARRPWSA